MLEIPKDKRDAINLHKEMHAIKHGFPLYFTWLQDQLHILDVENRTAAAEDFQQRQGGAQFLEFLITQMNKSQKEVSRLTA